MTQAQEEPMPTNRRVIPTSLKIRMLIRMLGIALMLLAAEILLTA